MRLVAMVEIANVTQQILQVLVASVQIALKPSRLNVQAMVVNGRVLIRLVRHLLVQLHVLQILTEVEQSM